MPKQVKQGRRPKDINQLAHRLVDLSTQEPDEPQESPTAVSMAVSQYMADIGRRGGQIGGKRRLKTLTIKQRSNIAKKAARARWKKPKKS